MPAVAVTGLRLLGGGVMPERHGDQRRAHHADRAGPPGELADPANTSVTRGGRKCRVVPAHNAILPAARDPAPAAARVPPASMPTITWERLYVRFRFAEGPRRGIPGLGPMQPSLATPLLVSCHQCAPPLRLAVRLARLRGAFEAPPSLVTRRWRSSLLSPGGAAPLRLPVRLARLRGAFEAPPSLVTRRWRSSLLSPGGAAPLRLAGERRGLARRPPGWLTSGHVGVFCLLSRNPLAVAPTRKTRPGQSGQSSEACQSAHP